MARKKKGGETVQTSTESMELAGKDVQQRAATLRPSALLDTRVIYCGDCLEQLRRLPDACVDLTYLDPPFNSNRNYEVFWGETKEKRAFQDRHESTQATIEFMRPRAVELARVLKKTGSFYYHCDWHACHYGKVRLDQIFGAWLWLSPRSHGRGFEVSATATQPPARICCMLSLSPVRGIHLTQPTAICWGINRPWQRGPAFCRAGG